MKILLLSLLLAVATHRSLLAQNVPAPPSTAVVPAVPNPAPASPGPASPLSYCAYVDAYCGYDFGNDGSNVRPSFLYSHNGQNEFSINQGVVGARYDNGLVRGALGLHAGSYVDTNYANESFKFRHLYEVYAGFRLFQKA